MEIVICAIWIAPKVYMYGSDWDIPEIEKDGQETLKNYYKVSLQGMKEVDGDHRRKHRHATI